MVVVGKGKAVLSDGNKWYSYSGPFLADIAVPATYTLTQIPDTGLRDSMVKITPYYGAPVAVLAGDALGIAVHIDDVEVYKHQGSRHANDEGVTPIDLFIPRQSKLTIFSMNAANNNTQDRGVIVVGWYL